MKRGVIAMAERKNKAAIKIGCQVGKLTVEAPTSQRKNGYIVWQCRCSCGGEILLDTRCLQRGTVRDCGCENAVKLAQKDLTGMRFGKLVCLESTGEKSSTGGIVWRCRCDCGRECLATTTHLTHGYKKSCGCLSHPPLKNFVGKRFGMLTVLEYAGKKYGIHHWRCCCDCGKETVVSQTLLQSGRTKSCGCLRKQQVVENLRLADGTSVAILEATKKRRIASNTSGYNGVYWNKRNSKWAAQITFKGKTYYLGSYDQLEEAVRARRRGEEMHNNFLEAYYKSKAVQECGGKV